MMKEIFCLLLCQLKKEVFNVHYNRTLKSHYVQLLSLCFVLAGRLICLNTGTKVVNNGIVVPTSKQIYGFKVVIGCHQQPRDNFINKQTKTGVDICEQYLVGSDDLCGVVQLPKIASKAMVKVSRHLLHKQSVCAA